jgi:hypothetical protein
MERFNHLIRALKAGPPLFTMTGALRDGVVLIL